MFCRRKNLQNNYYHILCSFPRNLMLIFCETVWCNCVPRDRLQTLLKNPESRASWVMITEEQNVVLLVDCSLTLFGSYVVLIIQFIPKTTRVSQVETITGNTCQRLLSDMSITSFEGQTSVWSGVFLNLTTILSSLWWPSASNLNSHILGYAPPSPWLSQAYVQGCKFCSLLRDKTLRYKSSWAAAFFKCIQIYLFLLPRLMCTTL